MKVTKCDCGKDPVFYVVAGKDDLFKYPIKGGLCYLRGATYKGSTRTVKKVPHNCIIVNTDLLNHSCEDCRGKNVEYDEEADCRYCKEADASGGFMYVNWTKKE